MGCSEPSNNNEDWKQWRNYVLKELERLNNNFDSLQEKQQDIRLDIREIQTKIYVGSIMLSFVVSIITTFLMKLI